ncbi:MAG: CBS domain-containing protein [Thermoplasmatota archaeon]
MIKQEFHAKRAEELMSKVRHTVEPLDPLTEALGKMKKHDLQELPVVEKGKLKGLLTFRTLARRRKMHISAHVKSFMISPPKVNPKDTLPQIVEKLINRDFTSLPVTYRSSLLGIISRRDIIKGMADDPELSKMNVETIMNFAPTTINGSMGVKKAMNMMDLTRETYTAIVDDAGKFLGVVSHSDIIIFMQLPPHKPHTGDFHGEKVHRDRAISSLASMPRTIARSSNLKEAVDLIVKNDVPVVYIMDGDRLEGSISEVDIMEVLLRRAARRGPLIQVAGIEDAKLMDASEINSLISKSVSKVEKFTKVNSVTVRIRHHHHDTDDDKYTINVKLTTPQTVISREAYDWDLNDAISNAFSLVEKGVKKDIGKKRKYH